MKKILYVITKSNFGGAQKSVFETISLLPKEKFVISVACGGKGILTEKLKALDVPVFEIPEMKRDVALLKDISSFFHILKIIKKEKPDIVHLHSPKAGALGALACRIHIVFSSLTSLLSTTHYQLPTILYTSHGWPFLESRPWWQKQILKFISFITILLSHKTVVISETEKNLVSSWPLTKNKLVLIPLLLFPERFLSRSEARKELEKYLERTISQEEYIVGSIGELTRNKGFQNVIKALEGLPEVTYVIVGGGELEETLRKDAPSNVSLTGYIEGASRLIKAFDVLLLPSLKEGLPYTLLEATQAELPLLGTNVGSVSEVITEGKNGFLLEPKDLSTLKEKLLLLKNKCHFSKENLEKTKNYIAEKYNKNNTVTKLENLYEKI